MGKRQANKGNTLAASRQRILSNSVVLSLGCKFELGWRGRAGQFKTVLMLGPAPRDSESIGLDSGLRYAVFKGSHVIPMCRQGRRPLYGVHGSFRVVMNGLRVFSTETVVL